jgi:hypothetical protein
MTPMKPPDVGPLPNDFPIRWATWYDDVAPLGFMLRNVFSDRWLRIHSLPNAKHSPTTESEYAELLRRHNAVATSLLGDGEQCAVLVFGPLDKARLPGLGRRVGLTRGSLPFIARLPSERWGEEAGVVVQPMGLFGGTVTWSAGRFDRFIIAVADELASGLLVNLASGRAYAPYDGGADLFWATEIERDAARARYRSWLSQDPSGL